MDSFAGLVHLRIALLGLVLGGRRRGDQRGVHHGSFPQQQAACGEVGVDGGKEALAQIMRFEEMTKLQQRGGIGHALGLEIDAGETLQGLTVVKGVFQRFIGQPIPLLKEIDAQQALQSDGWTAAFTFGIERRNDGEQFRPRDEGLHAREELLPAGDLLLGGKLGRRKTRLVGHASSLENTHPAVCNKSRTR